MTRPSFRHFRPTRVPFGGLLGLALVACQQPAAPPPAAPETQVTAALQPAPATPEPAQPAPAVAAEPVSADFTPFAVGFQELWMHDECTGPFEPQPDTCSHEQVHERKFQFGGDPSSVYDVTLHVRGIFEPTTIEGGSAPDPEHPYFVVGGTVKTTDWSYWHIEVSEPKQVYYLNHYPSVAHIIYKEDFQATLAVAGGAEVVVRVIDGNTRQIDNGEVGPVDRQQTLEGITETPLAGQMLRLDVVDVKLRASAEPPAQ